MRTLSIVSTPFQLFCLKEYFIQKKIVDYYIIAFVENQNQRQRLENLSKLINLHVDEIQNLTPIRQYLKIFLLALNIKKCNELIIGNYFYNPHLFFLNNIKYKSLTVMDDGITSSFIEKYYSTNNRIKESGMLKELLFKILGINISYPKHFKLFTMFDISTLDFNIQKNNLSYVKSLFKDFTRTDKTYIIGQPFVDLNILTEDLYLSCLKKLKIKYKNLLYVAGRKEKDQTLISMKKKINLDFIKPNINIEHLMIEKKELPLNIIGFTSSALYTIDKIYNHSKNNISIFSYEILQSSICNDNIMTKTKYSFKSHYDQLKQNGIKTIN